MPIRLGFLTTHPIQYQVPVFRLLAATPDVEFTVFYCMLPDRATQGHGFKVAFEWDVPLLGGYDHVVLDNIARRPSVTQFRGCDTPGVFEALRRRRLDVLVVNGWVVKSCLQALRSCKRLGIRCLVRGEANDLRPRAWWKRALQARLVRQFDACLPIGKANHAFYRSRGVPESRLFSAPYCVENDRFIADSERPTLREEVRERLGIPASATCFLFSGKLERKKHPDVLIHAFSATASQRRSVHLLMVGDGELRPDCERMARERGLPISFAGFVNQSGMPGLYAAADCLVLPSDHGETWGLVVNEAMACSRPAIVSDQVGCAADLVTDGRTGYVFPCSDVSALATLLVRAADDPAHLLEMGRRARQRIETYSPAHAADGILAAVRAILPAATIVGGRPACRT